MSEIINEVNKILEEPSTQLEDTGNGFRYSDKQIRTITAQMYKLNWKRKALFNYICNTFEAEGIRERLTPAELKYSNISSLYKLLDKSHKRKIIQRLDKIILKNKQKGSK